MKVNKLKFFLSTTALLILVSCCTTDSNDDPNAPPQLPPLTFEGKNTLGCKINGKIWVASTPFFSMIDAFRMGYDSTSGHFGINSWWVTKDQSIYENLSFESLFSSNVIGSHSLIKNMQDVNYLDVANKWRSYYIDVNLINYVDIKFHNTQEKILSGTFEFTVIDNINADTLVITDGRFDGRY